MNTYEYAWFKIRFASRGSRLVDVLASRSASQFPAFGPKFLDFINSSAISLLSMNISRNIGRDIMNFSSWTTEKYCNPQYSDYKTWCIAIKLLHGPYSLPTRKLTGPTNSPIPKTRTAHRITHEKLKLFPKNPISILRHDFNQTEPSDWSEFNIM